MAACTALLTWASLAEADAAQLRGTGSQTDAALASPSETAAALEKTKDQIKMSLGALPKLNGSLNSNVQALAKELQHKADLEAQLAKLRSNRPTSDRDERKKWMLEVRDIQQKIQQSEGRISKQKAQIETVCGSLESSFKQTDKLLDEVERLKAQWKKALIDLRAKKERVDRETLLSWRATMKALAALKPTADSGSRTSATRLNDAAQHTGAPSKPVLAFNALQQMRSSFGLGTLPVSAYPALRP
jgi:chromosome segregation ATPase